MSLQLHIVDELVNNEYYKDIMLNIGKTLIYLDVYNYFSPSRKIIHISSTIISQELILWDILSWGVLKENKLLFLI